MITFRWFGPNDPIPLRHIRQIPAVRGIVSALFDIPVGQTWPVDRIARLIDDVEDAGLSLEVIESIPVHEDIKLGKPTRDRFIENYCQSVSNMGRAGVPVLCYNFMPVFDWTRTELARTLDDGSTALAYDDAKLAAIDLSGGTGDLPGWAAAYSRSELDALMRAYKSVSETQLWDNFAYFLERVVPAAADADVRMALHPDDPPWSIFGLPRIITDGPALDRVTRIADDPANGVTFCTGSLAADSKNDLPAMARTLGERGRIHFAHCRNIKRTGTRSFEETAHPSDHGDVDMRAVLAALREANFSGPIRSDHGRMIWDEEGRPGYGLHDRALGAMYLHGLWEGLGHPERSEGSVLGNQTADSSSLRSSE